MSKIKNPEISSLLGTHMFSEPRRLILNISHAVVLVLSLLLIVYISYDTFAEIPFLENHSYMTFQFWTCIAFLVDFFIELVIANNKLHYLKMRWFFFVISIPYLNIINLTDLRLGEGTLFYIRFIPLIRGVYSLAMVMGYISSNRAASMVSQYVSILLAMVYCLSLIFYYQEHGVNPDVKSFWDALYFSAMNTVTVGCNFSAMTTVGKIISVVLPIAGMLMLPLFTVYITSKIQAFDTRRKQMLALFERNENNDGKLSQQAGQTQPSQGAAPEGSDTAAGEFGSLGNNG